MASPNTSAFFRRALVAVACGLGITLQAIPTGRHILAGHIPPMAARLKPTGTMAETNRLRLALGLPLRNQAELTALLRDLYAPSSENYHQFLKPAEFAARFGPTEEDYAAVTAFARSHGLRVVQTHGNRLLLDVEGSVADVQKAFHVNMNVFRHPKENRTFYAPDTEPSVEAGLPLLHVSGMDNYLLPTPNLVVRSGTDRARAATGSGTGGAFMGRDFRAAYAPGVTLDGAGQTIALVEFDTYFAKDITTYETTAGLPSVPVTAIPVDGFSGPPGGGVTEVSLDIELSISMAPGLSQILVYEAPNSSTSVDDDLLNEMAEDDLANQIACCWLFAIDPTTDLIFSQMAAQGQSFFAASGDYGAYDFDIPLLESDPNITLVGGTTLTTTGAGGAWTGETVWNWYTSGESPPSASSGGISSSYAIPYWQQAMDVSSNQASSVWRNVPDVSLTGDNVVLIANQGVVSVGGGTSCATPLWAGFTALINQQAAQYGRAPVGFLNPAIYGAAQSSLYASIFHDTTNGNNTNYNSTTQFYAAPGYDLCTGWGTPTGKALIDVLAPPDSLVFKPRGGLTFSVANGYALPIETQTLALKNSENTTINWAFGAVPKWLSASATKGSISPTLPTFVTLAAAGAATNLAPGNYVTNLLITNLTAGVTHLIPVFLQVFDPLLITPDSGMPIIGPVGGPFSETEQDYSLTNFASVPMNWTAQSTSAFADVSPSGGTLQPGDSTNVIVTLDPSASNALISAQSGNLLFTDLNTSYTQSLPFSLTIGNGGFETGDFTDWTFQGGTFPTNFVAGVLFFEGNLPAADYIHSGAYAAFLGEAGATGSLSQSLPTTAGQLYELSFFLNNPVGGETNQFEVMWDGVALFDQINMPLFEWTNMQFAVAATGASSTLKFVFRNDPDYFGFDDISVTPMPSPTFSSGTLSSNSVLISWNAIPGGVYQLEVSTDLSNWIKDGHTITATNSVMTAKENIVHSDVQQYFRLYLLAK